MNIQAFFQQFIFTLKKHREAPDFIRKHQLWKGMFGYGWITQMLVIIALIIGIKLFSVVWDWWFKADLDNVAGAFNSMSMLVSDFFSEGYKFVFMGSMKYVMLILMEVVVFHFCRRTLSILTKKDSPATFDEFLKAQIRMIKVSIRSWVLESILTMLIGIALNIAGHLEFLKPVLVFGVQCYYLGFAILDNYNEQFDLSISESAKYAQNFVGVSLALGLLLNVLLYIPLVGAVFAPLLSAVAATMVMYKLSDLHILGKDIVLKTEEYKDH